MYLDALAAWQERNREGLAAAGIESSLSERSSWDKPSQVVLFSDPSLDAQVTVWGSGECDVYIGDVATGDTEVIHHELRSDDELLGVLEGVRGRFGRGLPQAS